VCNGLKGLPDAVTATWERTVVQQCVVHLLRASFRYASKKDWGRLGVGLKPVYLAPSEAAARAAFEQFTADWGDRYPAIITAGSNCSAIAGVDRGSTPTC